MVPFCGGLEICQLRISTLFLVFSFVPYLQYFHQKNSLKKVTWFLQRYFIRFVLHNPDRRRLDRLVLASI